VENDRLIAININLTDAVQAAASEYTQLSENNDDLTATNQNLTDKVETLETVKANLTSTGDDLSDRVDNLTTTSEDLSQQADDITANNTIQASQIVTLQNENADLVEAQNNLTAMIIQTRVENEYYEEYNSNLTSVVAFLDNNGVTIEPTSDELVLSISETIDTMRPQLVRSIKISYDELVDGYPCNVDVAFGSREFVKNRTTGMTQIQVGEVVGYLEDTVLERMCLGKADFEKFLTQYADIANNGTVSYALINEAMLRYYIVASDYYFPEQQLQGLSDMEWANADYECQKLPDDLKFSY
jgi:cell division protein FtsB